MAVLGQCSLAEAVCARGRGEASQLWDSYENHARDVDYRACICTNLTSIAHGELTDTLNKLKDAHHVQARVTSTSPGKGEPTRSNPSDALVLIEFHEALTGLPICLPFPPEFPSILVVGILELLVTPEGNRTDEDEDIGWPVVLR